MRRSSSCRLGLLLLLPPPLPPLVGAFGVKGKLGQQAKEEGRQAEAGSREHDAPTARARAGRVGSGVWTLEEGRDLGRSLDREIYSAQCPRPLDPFRSFPAGLCAVYRSSGTINWVFAVACSAVRGV